MQFTSISAKSFKLILNGLVDLIYPPTCLICEKRLSGSQKQICRICLEGFCMIGHPHDHFSVPGEIYLGTAWALFEFDAGFQNMIHHLKYSRRRKPVLVVLEYYESQIKEQLPTNFYDLVISIPLHPRKLRERGYNQVDDMSRWLAKLLAADLGNPWVTRLKYTKTQTQLNALERQVNVAHAFSVKRSDRISGQHILLVDDVLTTGATANSLAQELAEAGAVRIDLITLSTPRHEPGDMV